MRNLILSIFLIMLINVSLQAQNERMDSPNKEEVQYLDSLYMNFVNSQPTDKRNKGQQIITELIRQQFGIDSLLLDNSLPDADFERRLTKEVAIYLLRYECFQQCFAAAKRLLHQAQKANDTTKLIKGYYLMGMSSQKMGDIDKGLEYGHICYDLCKTVNNVEILSSTLNNLGNIYMTNNQDSVAIVYFLKSLEIERQLGRKEQQAIRLGNISSAYIKTNQLSNALAAATEGLKLSREVGRLDRIAVRLHQLSNVYLEMKDFEKAKKCEREAYEYFKDAQSIYGQSITLNSLGKIEQIVGNASEADKLYKEALFLAEQQQNKLLTKQVCENLYKLNRTGNPSTALFYLERFTVLKDSIFQAENQKQINDFRTKYETQEKERELIFRSQQLKSARRIYILSFIILFLLIIIIIYLIISRKQRKKQAEDLKKSNDTKDKLFSIISHDLKAPVFAQKLAIDGLANQIKSFNNKDIEFTCCVLQENASEQVALIENMTDWARVQTDKIKFMPQIFDITPLILNEIKLHTIAAKNKLLKFRHEPVSSCLVFADKQMIGIVLRNLISNAIKFSNTGKEIIISCQCQQQKAIIEISDKGIGMNKQRIDELYASGSKMITRPGTHGEKGTGLGLILCKDLLEKHNSRLIVQSEEGIGTTFSFSLTCKKLN